MPSNSKTKLLTPLKLSKLKSEENPIVEEPATESKVEPSVLEQKAEVEGEGSEDATAEV
jgi:hypothetical protein